MKKLFKYTGSGEFILHIDKYFDNRCIDLPVNDYSAQPLSIIYP